MLHHKHVPCLLPQSLASPFSQSYARRRCSPDWSTGTSGLRGRLIKLTVRAMTARLMLRRLCRRCEAVCGRVEEVTIDVTSPERHGMPDDRQKVGISSKLHQLQSVSCFIADHVVVSVASQSICVQTTTGNNDFLAFRQQKKSCSKLVLWEIGYTKSAQRSN